MSIEEQLQQLDERLAEIAEMEAHPDWYDEPMDDVQMWEARDRIFDRIAKLGGLLHRGRLILGPKVSDMNYPEIPESTHTDTFDLRDGQYPNEFSQ